MLEEYKFRTPLELTEYVRENHIEKGDIEQIVEREGYLVMFYWVREY